MAINEILYIKDSDISFVADNTVLEIAIAFPPVPAGYYKNADGFQYFQPNDNLLMVGAGYRLPYCFTAGTDVPRFSVSWEQIGPPPQSVDMGSYLIPEPDIEFPFQNYTPWPSTLNSGEKSRLEGVAANLNISQIGAPDSLNGLPFYVYPWIHIIHNLPMVP